jgi:hypothetical protein
MSSTNGNAVLARALVLSHECLAAAEKADTRSLALLDAERLRLLKSLRFERGSLSADDRLVLKQVVELNDRAIGLMEHHKRRKERAMDTAVVGRRAVAAYSSVRLQR